MGESILSKFLSLSDSIYLLLLLAVSIAFWRLLVYNNNRNEDRENRYIGIIDKLSESFQGLQRDVEIIKDRIKVKD